jgi:hypothetical protein
MISVSDCNILLTEEKINKQRYSVDSQSQSLDKICMSVQATTTLGNEENIIPIQHLESNAFT